MINKQNISDTKIFSHLDRILGDKRPITADIFLNNYCNNLCPYCTYRRWDFEDGARYMSFENFVKYATRLKELGAIGFILTGGGEPTISKDFMKIANWLSENHYHWGINTNFNEMRKIKPDYLKVSLDGWDSNSYIEKRGVDSYQRVYDNIQEYAEWKRTNSPSTSLGIQLVTKSVSEVLMFYKKNKDLPVDYISFRPVESTRSQYYKTLPDEFDTNPDEIIRAIQNIASLDERVIINYKWDFLTHSESSCTAQWAQIAINEIGEVMYCCHKPYQIVGHIMDDDILEKKEKAFTDMSMCDVPCRMTAPNFHVSKLMKRNEDVGFI